MITFLDENDVEYGALSTIKATNAVNGERSLTGTIVSGDYVLSNIERGWRLRFDDEYYVVTYAKPIDEGRDVQVTFDAVHQFFWDFDKSSVYDQLTDGSHTFVAYLDFIFKNSGYSYTVDSALNVYAFEKQSFGLKKRLTLFNDVITSTGVEFQVNGKVVRILEKVGTDLSTVVRKNFNMNELTIEKNIGDFVTYQKGYGAYFDEEDHSKGRLEVEYTSTLASVYGKLEAEPLVDERYTQSSSLLSALKESVDNSYTISVSLDMEDLTHAGYKYTQPIAGDYIMAINETLDFQEKIRIVSFTSEYDVQGILVKHEVTCNDIGTAKKLTASYNTTKRQASTASANAIRAYNIANKALVSADGKNTNYYGNSFPQDTPKGTLKTGDLLFLTVGDTVKQYYWNGAEWIINPVVSDVEAFKEQIAEELKEVPDREEFEATIAQELATSKAELETQIDTAKTQAESNAKAYADEINQATAEVAEQANTTANSLKSDLAKVQTDLTATTSTANAAKTSASEAKQQLTTVANDLNTAKQDLQTQASQLTAQASAQSELTKRVSSVEETANGTKTTVSELSKTVAQNGKDITSVTARTKTVEDDLTSTKTTLSQVKTTADSTSQKTATLETGLNGVKADLAATTATADTTKTNLANYQASNNRAVANLQSDLQTANGNISSLQTKVEAVPGQITSAVSAVEGKIPTEIGGRNLYALSKEIGRLGAKGGATNLALDVANGTLSFDVNGAHPYFGECVWGGINYLQSYGQLIPVKVNSAITVSFSSADFNENYVSFVAKNKGAKGPKVFRTQKVILEASELDGIEYIVVRGGINNADGSLTGKTVTTKVKVEYGNVYTDWTPAPEDIASQISSLSSQIQQTADGITLLATKTELNTAKSDLQSGIITATNKANAAQSTADSNAKTISTHTTQISALNTGLSAKVSQTDFNTLSGRVTTAESNLTATANELSSKISSLTVGNKNYLPTSKVINRGCTNFSYSETSKSWTMTVPASTTTFGNGITFNTNGLNILLNGGETLFFGLMIKASKACSFNYDINNALSGTTSNDNDDRSKQAWSPSNKSIPANVWTRVWFSYTAKTNVPITEANSNFGIVNNTEAITVEIKEVMVAKSNVPVDYQTPDADFEAKDTEFKQTADSIKASVSALDGSTVKTASLTINTDGVVMKAGKSTTDIANAIGSYFSVNQNAINLFSDKINVKGNMIVDGAITSAKIASKSINTAHLNGKIITADVISSNAVTADAIKAGAVTTDKMTANSINGDRITAGTLDAVKIKAASITASQIASGTITSSQIKSGTISAANIATGAVTTDKIAANSINSDKIVSSGITANVIKGGKLQSLSNATNFELDTGKLFYNNNNTGIFRVQDNASTMGLKFSNTSITVSGTSRILSRVILGGDRRETTLDDGKWDQGGFSGIVVETINGVAANDHERADSLRVIADNIYFGHSYNKDVATNTSAAGWKMETYSSNSTYTGHVVMKPFGINSRYADIVTGDVRLDNGDGSGYWVRGCIQVLRNCFQHFLNGGTSDNAKNAIRNALRDISGV